MWLVALHRNRITMSMMTTVKENEGRLKYGLLSPQAAFKTPIHQKATLDAAGG